MPELQININGTTFEFFVKPKEMLSSLIRRKAGLTGTKEGCSQGSCGACTVLLDGQPVLSCITPALRCAGRKVTTIEALAEGGKLHRLQEKFVRSGAVQCGFCSPGMIMTALAFTKENPSASREEIKQALSGNLCRCTGYKKIIDAVADYVSEPAEGGENTMPGKESAAGIVGKPRPNIEAESKVKGSAKYADDYIFSAALHCKFLRSAPAHARILSIDVSEAEKLEGVRSIVTGKELPISFGVLPVSQDETAMAVEKVRYAGEIVAAVAAETEEIAEEACRRIKVNYAPLREFLTPEDSLNDIGSDEKIHGHCKFNNNVHKKAGLRFGDQKQALEASDFRSKMSFSFQGINHGFTEPHAAVACWDEKGLTVITATQVPHYLHRALAKVLQVPLGRVRVLKPQVGGGFGGKSDPFPHEIIIAHLARKTGRPVRVRFTREEVFITNHGRHPTEITLELGMNAAGTFTALDAGVVIDGGAYGSFGVVTSYYNGVLLQAPYKLDNFGFETYRVYTNKPQSGAMRGHGAVNSRFAVESIIDDLAFRSGIDPCELRLRNFITPSSITVGQYRITSNGVRESLQKVMEQSGWGKRKGKLPLGTGLGAACGFFISGSALPIIWNELPQSVVHLKVDFDGRVLVLSGASDIGQGSDTMLAMIVAEVLGIEMERVAVVAADTLLTPVDLGSYSSRVTFMAGNAARDAALKLKEEILTAVCRKTGLEPEELQLQGGRVASSDYSVVMSWDEAVDLMLAGRGAVTVSGKYISPRLGGDFKGAGAGLSPSYSFGACIAEVKVDTGTGMVKINKVWGAHDCGRAINPLAVEGQLEGSWHMGIGQAMMEEIRYHKGLLLNNNFLDYKIPTSVDTPDIATNIIETQDPEGPFGAKECGEGALHPVIPAIANAVFDAVGVRLSRLPIDAAEVLKGLKEKEKNYKQEAV